MVWGPALLSLESPIMQAINVFIPPWCMCGIISFDIQINFGWRIDPPQWGNHKTPVMPIRREINEVRPMSAPTYSLEKVSRSQFRRRNPNSSAISQDWGLRGQSLEMLRHLKIVGKTPEKRTLHWNWAPEIYRGFPQVLDQISACVCLGSNPLRVRPGKNNFQGRSNYLGAGRPTLSRADTGLCIIWLLSTPLDRP